MRFIKVCGSLFLLTLVIFTIWPLSAGHDGAASFAPPPDQKQHLSKSAADMSAKELDILHSKLSSQNITAKAGETLSGELGSDYIYDSQNVYPPKAFSPGSVKDKQSDQPLARVDIATTISAILSSAPAAVVKAIRSTPDKYAPRQSR
jgi:hypothetical protein